MCANLLPDDAVYCARCGWSMAVAGPAFGAPAPPFPAGAPPPPVMYAAFAPPRRTNGMAVASLCTSIGSVLLASFTCGLGGVAAPVGAILGHISLSQIRRSGEEGRGIALAGIIVGWVVTLLLIAGVVLLVVVLRTDTSTD